jgi:hypothetical protein
VEAFVDGIERAVGGADGGRGEPAV